MNLITRRIENYFQFQQPLVWRNIIGIFALHVASLYNLFFLLLKGRYLLIFYSLLVVVLGGIGITAGAHRLWTHRTYKAKLPLRILLMILFTSTGQYSLVQWARDHRTHHKFTDTNADPHNASRGFWFSHVGWLMMKRHPDVKEKGKLIDVSDLWEDPVVRFHQKYFIPLLIPLHVILPSAVAYYWLEYDLIDCIMCSYIGRYCISLNSTWMVNSVSHIWGYKPYNKKIRATENKLGAFLTLGEGWHNFHHVFPWDYRIGEFGNGFQIGTYFIQVCAWLGLAYDLKYASDSLINKVVEKADKDPIYETSDPEYENSNAVNSSKLKNT